MRINIKAMTVFLIVILVVVFGFVLTAGSLNKEDEPTTIKNEPAMVIAAAEPITPNVSVLASNTTVSVESVTEQSYPLTEEEIELIALVTMGEAEGETELGKRLVIDTILNRMDNSHFPDTIHDVIYQKNQFSVMWNGRIDRCYIMPEIVELVKEELLERTDYDCVFFMAGGYSRYGKPMFQECCHYFSSYE